MPLFEALNLILPNLYQSGLVFLCAALILLCIALPSSLVLYFPVATVELLRCFSHLVFPVAAGSLQNQHSPFARLAFRASFCRWYEG